MIERDILPLGVQYADESKIVSISGRDSQKPGELASLASAVSLSAQEHGNLEPSIDLNDFLLLPP